ncbi:MAG: twin-arginine translocase TatA/TatE family subunit [Thermoplasmata archaeon]
MFGLGPAELAVIVGLALLIFGPRQLPKLGKSLGQTIREFRNAGRELTGLTGEEESND